VIRTFWLDGGGARPWSGRRSIIGILGDEDVSLTYSVGQGVARHSGVRSTVVGDDIFDVLEQEVARDDGDPDVHWVGYLGYACRADLPARPAAGVPDAVWMRVRQPMMTEHELLTSVVEVHAERASKPPRPYVEAFERVQEALHGGYSYEVNLTYRETVLSDLDPESAYLRLRASNPAPYAGFLQHGDVALLSSSPERYATVDRHRWLETKPIKGTTQRGKTQEEDRARQAELAQDPRFRAENLMIVDLLRNDLSEVCQVGTVTVPSLMRVESYSSVHQLVSTVRGHLRGDVTTIGALRALFPAGSMTGAPKLQTMRIIEEIEETPRGIYAGAFGWISADGRADLGVVIRSLVATAEGDRWRYEYGTGGGITVQSDVDSEYAETRWKAERLRGAVRTH